MLAGGRPRLVQIAIHGLQDPVNVEQPLSVA